MLDEPDSAPADPQHTQAPTSDLPTPPRGRRAASRPAGPPKPVDTSADTMPSAPATEFESELQARLEAQLASRATSDPIDDAVPTAEKPASPPRKRSSRARSAAADKGADTPTPDTRPSRRASSGETSGAPRRRSRKAPESAAQPEVVADLDAAVPTDTPVRSEPDGRVDTTVSESSEGVPAPFEDRLTTEGPSDEQQGAAEERAEAPGEQLAEDSTEEPADELTDEATEEPADELAEEAQEKPSDESTEESIEAPQAEGAPGTDTNAEIAGEDIQADGTAAVEASQTETETDSDRAEGEDESAEDSGDGATRRRRRRRGGRRRRRGASRDATDAGEDSEDSDEAADSDSEADGDEESGGDESVAESGTDDSAGDGSADGRRRRRRRRRRGEDTGGDDDPDTEVVLKVREPRRGKASDEVTGIEGSTRLEAKRQRRREGRAAGRRRTPILSEAEFLARRESVQRTMVIRQNDELSQIAVLEDSVLVEHYVDRASATSLIGNVYLGRVQNVLPSMEAAFIDIGRGRNAVLYAGEVDWDSFGAEGQARKVEKVLKSGSTILVQVTKDPVGAKGARLTNHISLPGRYIVYSPGGHLSGISRKLPDTERKRLKEILGDLIGEDASVIVRTAAEGSSEDELIRDVNRLKAQWEVIEKQIKGGQAPQQLYAEPDATVRIVRDLFTEDFSRLVIDGNGAADDAYDTVTAYVSHVAPHLAERIESWDPETGDVFAAHRIDEQIAKALERKVFLPSGGSLIIDRTEAMTVIDVNTGKFTGSGGNLEATVTSNNLEAAEEVVRQLRLRDIGGIIVIDFIDMVLPSNRELLLRRLVECLGRDRTRHQVAEVTSLGLVQMTRKKIGTGLAEAFTEPCECCNGRGYEIHEMPVESQSQADGGERGRRGRGARSGTAGSRPDPVRPESGRGDRGRRSRGAESGPEESTDTAASAADEPSASGADSDKTGEE